MSAQSVGDIDLSAFFGKTAPTESKKPTPPKQGRYSPEFFKKAAERRACAETVKLEFAPVETKVEPQKLDKIDELLAKKSLQDHPKVLTTILKDLHLTKFWKQLNTATDRHVFIDLAQDRMLNFYEAAVFGNFTHREIRMGLIAAALTATYHPYASGANKGTVGLTNVESPIPCFVGVPSVDLSVFKLTNLSADDIAAIEKIVKCFARKMPSRETLNKDAIAVYLFEACMMWPLSKNPKLIDFMMGFDRKRFLESEDHKRIASSWMGGLGFLNTVTIKQYREFGMFNTRWGRAKSFEQNLPAKLRALK